METQSILLLAIVLVTTGMLSKWDIEKDTRRGANHAITGDAYMIVLMKI